MRAFVGHVGRGIQAAAALYVVATLALTDFVPTPHANPPPVPIVAEENEPPAPATVKPEPVAAVPEPPKEPERPRAAIGFNVPEGQFDFAPAAEINLRKGDPEPFPFAPAPAPANVSPPLVYRRGRPWGPMRVFRNPWADPANPFRNNPGLARGRALAFDDRADAPPPGFAAADLAGIRRSWRADVAQYRRLTGMGFSDDDLKHRLGDRYSSVRWAASLDVALEELPEPTDSYAAALAREQKAQRR
jgi:hypothetical protein